MTERANLWRSGIPIAPDVTRLHEVFGERVKTHGALIEYTEIETVLKVGYGSRRFATVTKVWRKELHRDQSVVLDPAPSRGVGLTVLTDRERVGSAIGRARRSSHEARSGLRYLAAANPAGLSAQDLRAKDGLAKQLADVEQRAKMAARTAAVEFRAPHEPAPKMEAPAGKPSGAPELPMARR